MPFLLPLVASIYNGTQKTETETETEITNHNGFDFKNFKGFYFDLLSHVYGSACIGLNTNLADTNTNSNIVSDNNNSNNMHIKLMTKRDRKMCIDTYVELVKYYLMISNNNNNNNNNNSNNDDNNTDCEEILSVFIENIVNATPISNISINTNQNTETNTNTNTNTNTKTNAKQNTNLNTKSNSIDIIIPFLFEGYVSILWYLCRARDNNNNNTKK